MPEALLAKIKAARNFNQGFATVEYLAAAIVDLDLHVMEDAGGLDVDAFEKKTLEKIGTPPEIGMRHRIPHFQHIIGGYASGYYSYMWSEVMDADAFKAFEETGDVFDRATGEEALREHLLGRRQAGPGRRLQGLPRAPADDRRAAREAGACGRGGVR